MKTINDLTSEKRAKIPKYKSIARAFYKSDFPFDRKSGVRYIEKIYEIAGQKKPVIVFAKSPTSYKLFWSLIRRKKRLIEFIFRKKNNLLRSELDSELYSELGSELYSELRSELDSELGSELYSELDSELYSELDSELRSELYSELDSELYSELGSELDSELYSELDSELYSELDSELDSELYSELYSELGSELYSELRSELDSELYSELYSELDSELYSELGSELYSELGSRKIRSHYLFLCDFYARAYLTWYKFISYEFDIEHKSKSLLNELYNLMMKSSISRCYFTKGYVLVLKTPESIHFNQSRLHNENGPAIEYEDFKMYYWKGTKVPEKLIMRPNEITKDDLRKNQNAELRRCFIEKLGVTRYFEILSEGKGLSIIDTDTDNQGNVMKLMSFEFEGQIIQILEVICPSTERVYNLYPPSQNCKNVWQAKADTFNKEQLAYRHGDVGLVCLDKEIEKTLIET